MSAESSQNHWIDTTSVLIMDYIYNWCKSKRTLHGCTVIVTGGNCGIGKETCLDLYKRGARVIMACRNLEKAENAKADILKNTHTEGPKGSIDIVELDLNSLESVKKCAFSILSAEKNINVLINNAGVMLCPRSFTEEGFETQIGVNHFGHALLTLLLLPRIIKSAPSRIINVSSFAHTLSSLDFDDINCEKSYYFQTGAAYSRSKIANILFAKALHLKLRENGIENVNTYSLHPGIVFTELGRHLNNSIMNGASWIFYNIIGLFMKSPRCGAQTTIYCAVDEACDKDSGHYYDNCGIAWWVNSQCRNTAAALKLYDLSIKMLKLEDYDPFGKFDPTPSMFNMKM